ncbi:transcriptional regulator [Flavobacterium jejuense]|uniref:Transcriptional regulator n=1 Tax=Flavobacterium jejuense TaxID=1544455 RepID=A0ABX0IVQ4_9FLAO|nr:transcriptional regulator [Flavobacterium jejuense]NHN27271.1 transcriptional regulator [Flavobacterium jejuense]
MNYIKHLTGFFEKVAIDKTLNPTHVSLYIALFQFWNCNRFKNPISISRDEVMRISKISSKATYHKCLKNLHSLGYINYEPSYNPFKGSHVYLFNFSDDLKPIQKSERKPKIEPLFEQVDEQALNKSCTSDETSSEQALVPSINYINNTNNLNIENVSNLNEQAKKFEEINNFQLKNENLKEEKSSAKKEEKEFVVTSSIVEKPILEEVKSYFQENNFPELEAQKFFNYFSSNGWLVGGKTPMVDWQAAAQNWILNSINFNHNTDTTPTNRPKHLNTTTDKDYSEPL